LRRSDCISIEEARRSLGIKSLATDQIKEARRKAAKYAIWSELSKIFEEYLGLDRYIALCAVPVSTSKIESMSIIEKTLFLDSLRKRAANQQDPMIPTLKRIVARFKGGNTIEPELEEQIEDFIVIDRETTSQVQKDTLFKYISID
jgi:hypothetical protein